MDNTTTTTRKPHLAFVAYLFLALPMALLCEALSPQTATGRRYHSSWKRQDRSAPKFRRLATAVELDNSYQREYYTVAEEVLEAYAQKESGFNYNITYIARKTRCRTTSDFSEDKCAFRIKNDARLCNVLLWQDRRAEIRDTYYYKCDQEWSQTYD